MLLDVDKSFYVIGLRPGSLFIGYLYLILDLVLTVCIIWGMSPFLDPPQSRLGQLVTIIYLVVFGIVLLFVLINLSFVILLLVGLHTNKPRLILAYLSCAYVYIVLAVVFGLLIAILQLPEASIYVIILTYVGVSIYFYVVIRSYYWQLNDRILAYEKSRVQIQDL